MDPSTTSSWNLTTNNGSFWSNGGFRKRKAAASDLDEKMNQKIFITEDKMVKEMQTLSLELETLNNTTKPRTPIPQIVSEPIDDVEEEEIQQEPHIEMHQLLKDSLKSDDLQDSLITKLCEMERKKLSMQIVPYIPFHPAQLTNENVTNSEEVLQNNPPFPTFVAEEIQDDSIFKIPSIPTPYTVEEPCDNTMKRNPTMKRSFSQSDQYSSNLSVTELKPDGDEYSSLPSTQSAYFIVEPNAAPSYNTSSSNSSSSLSTNDPSIRITEFNEHSPLNSELSNTLDDDDDVDMQSISSSDTGDKMDDD